MIARYRHFRAAADHLPHLMAKLDLQCLDRPAQPSLFPDQAPGAEEGRVFANAGCSQIRSLRYSCTLLIYLLAAGVYQLPANQRPTQPQRSPAV